jgi:formate-nitrite transporter family protein
MDQPDSETPRSRDPEPLKSHERAAVEERKSGSSIVLHEVVREEGEEELDRPFVSLLLSGLAAGVAISFSLLAQAALKSRLPDAPWAELVIDVGYTIGFIVVVLGRLQLFTESTVTPVLPVASEPSLRNLVRLLRLWVIVFTANLLGTLLVAWLAARQVIVSEDISLAMADYARELLKHDGLATLLLGMPAGFLVASIAWILPNARGTEIWVVMVLTYTVAVCGFSHVVAGSTKAWMLWLTAQSSLGHVLGGIILPSLVGNIIGGTGLFAVLAHGQVRHELKG